MPSQIEVLSKFCETIIGSYASQIDGLEDHVVCLRGVGEKGTQAEGKFRENIFLRAGEFTGESALEHVVRWNEHFAGAFILPALLDPKVLDSRKGDEGSVRWFTSLCVDLDCDDPQAAADYLRRHLPPPALVVQSGGITASGKPKLHLWWCLTEPTDDVNGVAATREILAAKVGGDQAFKRSTQIIRLPGSLHRKNGKRNAVLIMPESAAHARYDLGDLTEAIWQMPAMEGIEVKKPALAPTLSFTPQSANEGASLVDRALSEPISEGGTADDNRWSRFGQVAGHFIWCARNAVSGIDSLAEAYERTVAWVAANMNPPWPQARIESEFRALVELDVQHNGPIVARPKAELTAAPAAQPSGPVMTPSAILQSWSLENWTRPEPPPRRYMVQGLIQAGKHHLLAAEGGAGKTFALLDLVLKVAVPRDGDQWLGHALDTENCNQTAILLTTEDDAEEIHQRVAALDVDGRRHDAQGRAIILPALNIGGAQPLVELDRTGNPVPSRWWQQFTEAAVQLPQPPALLCVDTLNATLHGEENSAVIINQYVQAALQFSARTGAALLFTHHIRKRGDRPISDRHDMLQAIRGSSAIPAAFRYVIGLWEAPNAAARLTAMGLEPEAGRCYLAAVVKANSPEASRSTRTLVRASNGVLEDVTERDTMSDPNFSDTLRKRAAMLIAACKLAARRNAPYTMTTKRGVTPGNGLYNRKTELPPGLQSVGRDELFRITRWCVENRMLVKCRGGGSKQPQWLDVPGGPWTEEDHELTVATGSYDPPDWSQWFLDWPQGEKMPTYRRDNGGQRQTPAVDGGEIAA